jgi:predicted metalloendopeptidase
MRFSLLILLLVALPVAAQDFGDAAVDPSVPACENFYRHATGGWIARHPIPEDLPTFGTGNVIARATRERLRAILEEPTTNAAQSAAGRYYADCMDVDSIERQGLRPLRETMRAIGAIRTPRDIGRAIMELQMIGVDATVSIRTEVDRKDSSSRIAVIRPSLPRLSRSDYLGKSPDSARLTAAYITYIARLMRLSGSTDEVALDEAQAIVKLERTLADATLTFAQRRDVERTYNMYDLHAAEALTPHLPWTAFFTSAGVSAPARVNTTEPAFLRAVDDAIASRTAAIWRAYLRFVLLDTYASTLPADFEAAYFAFHSGAKLGVTAPRPRWRDCVAAVDSDFGTLLGQLYAERMLTAEDRKRVDHIIRNVVESFGDQLLASDWLTPGTRERAMQKLRRIRWEIGGPPLDPAEKAIRIEAKSYAGAAQSVIRQRRHRAFALLGSPVQDESWSVSPAEPNALFDQSRLELFLTAAILQPPNYDPAASDSWNYGAIGSVIGHELTHAFDDKGAHFDEMGNIGEWWTDEDRTRFAERVGCVRQRLEKYEVAGVRLDGAALVGEAIADRGGLKAAFRALEKTLPPDADRAKATREFFLGFAQMYARHSRPEWIVESIKNDSHPPAEIRVNDAVAGLPSFRDSFRCEVRPQCEVW